jgi:site-specific recombinase XerD
MMLMTNDIPTSSERKSPFVKGDLGGCSFSSRNFIPSGAEGHLTTYIQYLQEKSKSPATITNYYYDILQFITFIKIQNISAITENDSKAYLTFMIESIKMSNPSINRKMISLRLFYEYLRHNGQLTNNPFDFFHKLDVSIKPTSVLAPDLINRALDYLKISIDNAKLSDSKTALILAIRNDLIFRLMLYTGIRKTDLVKIKISHIQKYSDNRFILKLMNRGVRTIPLTDKIIPSLSSYLKHRGMSAEFLFLDEHGKNPISVYAVHYLFRNISCSLKTRITPGNIRAYFASQLSRHGSDVLTIHNILGNSKLETTLKYSNISMKTCNHWLQPVVNLI